MVLAVIPVRAERERGTFDLFNAISAALKKSDIRLQNGDVLVVSTKYVSYSQGRRVLLDGVSCSKEGLTLAKEYGLDADEAEVILRESDFVFGGVRGFVMAACGKILAPNAGIDMSNSDGRGAVLYPAGAYASAEQLRRKAFLEWSVHIGIILSDSRLAPARAGTTGVAVSCSGIPAVEDRRGNADLDGRPLVVTMQATADNIASIANHAMGEGAESTPIAIVRDSGARMTGGATNPDSAAVPYEKCLYVRGFGRMRHGLSQ